jgi:phospholipid transport system substrate-binding protein
MKKNIYVFLYLLILGATSLNAAEEPKAMVSDRLNKLIDLVVKHKEDKDFTERDKKIRNIFISSFDLVKMSGMTLGREIWLNKLSNDQKQAFVNKYAEFLLTFYIDKLGGYNGNEIKVKDAEMSSSGKKATVPSTVEFNGSEATIKYSLKKSSKGWRIYDVEVEGVRLTTTYRSQFTTLYHKKGYENLILELDNLIKKIKEKKTTVKNK